MKIRALRVKRDAYWIAIFLEYIENDIIHIGVNINKSKRAQNDWYKVRKNKRARRAANTSNKRHHKYLIELNKLLKKVIKTAESGTSLVITPSHKKTEPIHKYVERLGFTLIPMGDLQIWVLVVPQN